MDGKQLKDGYSFTGEMIYNDIGKNENFLGNPIANHKAIWMLNGQIIQDTTFNFGIYYTHHESLMHEGMNTLTLVVVSRATKQTIATVSIQIMGYKRYSADKIRVVANWNGMQGYLNNSQYLGDASRGLEPILVGTNIDFSLQVLQDTTWMVLSDVDWKHHDSLSQKSSQLTFNCIESYQSPEKITVFHPRMITDKIVVGVYQRDNIQIADFRLPYIDTVYRHKDSVQTAKEIANAYEKALKAIEKKQPAFYRLLLDLNITVKILDNKEGKFAGNLTTLGSTDDGVSIFMDDLDIDNITIDSTSKKKTKIIQNARLIVKLSGLDLKRIKEQVLEGKESPQSKAVTDLIALIKNSNPQAAESLNLALMLKDSSRVPRLDNFAYEVDINNVERFRELRNSPVVISLNWPAISTRTDGSAVEWMKKTIAHELVHASYPLENPVIDMKWTVIRATLGRGLVNWILGDQLGMNGKDGCSEGKGHEWHNPENVDSCKIEKN